MSMIVRAIIRSGIELAYSQGFNPRPKFSLPLPRPVGVASEDDVFCVGILMSAEQISESVCVEIQKNINAQLPEGCEMFGAEIRSGKCSLQAELADYEFVVEHEFTESVKSHIFNLNERLGNQEVIVERKINAKGQTKKVNVGRYIKTLVILDDIVKFSCEVTSGGSVRPNEVLGLLEVSADMLRSPVVRKKIQWQSN